MHRRTLIQKSAAQPRFRKTETGGKRIARKYRKTSPLEETTLVMMEVKWW